LNIIFRVVEQPKLLDELGKQMVTLCLAIPGLFATVLKLTDGDDTVLPANRLVFWAFGCRLVPLVLNLASLVPVTRKVARQVPRRAQPAAKGQAMGIEEFFTNSARYKRRRALLLRRNSVGGEKRVQSSTKTLTILATATQVCKKIRCCKCLEIFSLLIDTAGEPEISITCLLRRAAAHQSRQISQNRNRSHAFRRRGRQKDR
jgi:hypothetical protein